jgi:hypothetical protein
MPTATTTSQILWLQAVEFFLPMVHYIWFRKNQMRKDYFVIPSFVKIPLIKAFNLGIILLFDMQWTTVSLSNPSIVFTRIMAVIGVSPMEVDQTMICLLVSQFQFK